MCAKGNEIAITSANNSAINTRNTVNVFTCSKRKKNKILLQWILNRYRFDC